MGKENELTPEIFAGFIADFCSRSPLASGRNLFWTIIANPKAGGFTIKSRRRKNYEQLLRCANRVSGSQPKSGTGPSVTAGKENSNGLILTKRKGNAETITAELIREASDSANTGPLITEPLYLIVTAGGDGTSLEVLSTLFNAPAAILSRFAVLRLPMGTGNDGADAFELEEALRLIIDPSEIIFQRVIRLFTSTPGKGPFPAFNILSVGLDAFVTHMTNKMKGKLPGDFYKLWVDIASLFYDKIYKVDTLAVHALDDAGNEVKSFKEKILLLAVGESGHRCYGSQKHILPDDRNVCAIRQMPMLKKIQFKELFATGGHVSKPEAILFNASRVELSYGSSILAQMDGESVLLEPAD
ncbi:MAG: diacylglycerol kinase, partial [Treponema sp.]|nr:diacylglycerol kinase [Treponema sp.]